MKTLLVANIIGLSIALIGITIFFILWIRAEQRLARTESTVHAMRDAIEKLINKYGR